MKNSSKKLSNLIASLILDKKGTDIKILDVRELTSLTEFFIICTSDSAPKTRAITDYIKEELKKDGTSPWHIEGLEKMEWVLLDYVNIVINIFNPTSREYYNVERLWKDAIITEVNE
tara:strand:+ start:637 stop:987 length:351 start_codon:yes stop_codon:yes gene_type:complete